MQYFKHDCDMSQDVKVKRVIRKFGADGYYLYNIVLELITRNVSSEKPWPDLEETCGDIALEYYLDVERVVEIMVFLIDQKLLEWDAHIGRVICPKLYEHFNSNQMKKDSKMSLLFGDYTKYRREIVNELENGTLAGGNGDSCTKSPIISDYLRLSVTVSDNLLKTRLNENRVHTRTREHVGKKQLQGPSKRKGTKTNEQEDSVNEDGYPVED